jgi:hypothetical protein
MKANMSFAYELAQCPILILDNQIDLTVVMPMKNKLVLISNFTSSRQENY